MSTRTAGQEVSDDDITGSQGSSHSLGGNYKGEHYIAGFSVEDSRDTEGQVLVNEDGRTARPRLKVHLVSKKNHKPFSTSYSGYPRPGEMLPKLSATGQFYHAMRYTVANPDGTFGRTHQSAGKEGDVNATLVKDLNYSWAGLLVAFEEFGVSVEQEVEVDGKSKSVTTEYPEWTPQYKDLTGSRPLRRFSRPMEVRGEATDAELTAFMALHWGDAPDEDEESEDITADLLSLMAGKTRGKVLELAATLDQFTDIDVDACIDDLLTTGQVSLSPRNTFVIPEPATV